MTKTIILALMLLSLNAHADEQTYNQGLQDGCSSANNDWLNPFIKNVELYIKDAYYKTGWDDAYMKCKQEHDLMFKIIEQSGL